MPNEADHFSKAAHNEEFVSHLLSDEQTPYLDWAVVGIFYAALHHVDAFLAAVATEINIPTHTKRLKLVRQHMWRINRQ